MEKLGELEKAVLEMSEKIVAKIARFNQLREDYVQKKKQQLSRDLIKELSLEIKSLKKSLKQDWREWVLLSKNIMRLEVAVS